MKDDQIKEAGQKAQELARELAKLMLASKVPSAHFDEVLERLKQLLVDKGC